ncbi:MAG: type IV pilin protein [Nitrincola lacisaponensis]|uniref:type IV pilin protein n=1 Tax=Nitrincola lacisaponensis TaxID=267850 RepID=UPI003918FFC3
MAKNTGFTLIELMIVVAIIGILAAIAYPSYQDSIMKNRRAMAQGCLMEMAQHMERIYTTNLTYAADTAANTQTTLRSLGCTTEGGLNNFYTFNLPAASLTASAYVIEAVPQGIQAARDTGCATHRINQQGVKTTTGPDTCW